MTIGKVAQFGERAERPGSARKVSAFADAALPMAESATTVTVVVPTYKEVENLPHLIDLLSEVREASGLTIDLLIMDDDSRDGSVELVAARAEPWVQIVVRTENRGLSQAVMEGLQRARGDVLVCMDADLSHPPRTLPPMLAKLDAGADFVVGSRYV
jgi:dolichol-phosphate mannosyltransferase